jgi:hypothetical protein
MEVTDTDLIVKKSHLSTKEDLVGLPCTQAGIESYMSMKKCLTSWLKQCYKCR